MGNLCGKPSKENDPFAQPGRTVGSAPPPQSSSRAPVPKIDSQGRKLGGVSGGEDSDARSAAARAAEVRTLFVDGKIETPGPHSDGGQTTGAGESASAEGQAGQGFSEREGADEGWDVGER